MVEDDVCTGMDVPVSRWAQSDLAFWSGSERYQPWKDVAAFFNPPRSVQIELAPSKPLNAPAGVPAAGVPRELSSIPFVLRKRPWRVRLARHYAAFRHMGVGRCQSFASAWTLAAL